MQPITSAQNPKVKFLRSLRMRKVRHRENCFLAEGVRILEEALHAGAPIDTLVYAPELLRSRRAEAILERVEPHRRLALSGDLFRSLSNRDEPQGIAAVIRIEDCPAASIPLSDDLLIIIAWRLRDPGNLGSIIRTADAAGATALITVGPSVDLYDPQTVRATMGSLFALPIIHEPDQEAVERWFGQIREAGIPLRVIASSAHGELVYFDVDYDHPLALIVGNEQHGLPASLRQTADAVVRLPMAGRASSLNVSAATAALVYEIVRQRGAGPGR